MAGLNIKPKYQIKLLFPNRRKLIPFIIVCVVAGVVGKEIWLFYNQTEAEYGKIPWNKRHFDDQMAPLKDESGSKNGRTIDREDVEKNFYDEDKRDVYNINNDDILEAGVTSKYIPFEEFDYREREAELYLKFQKAMTQDDFLSTLKFDKWGTNCILPTLDPFHPSIKEKVRVYRGNHLYPCKIENEKLVIIKDGKLWYDKDAIANNYFQNGSLQCSYREIMRDTSSSDPDNYIVFGPSILFNDGTDVSHIEFLNVFCYGANGEIMHEDIGSHPQIREAPMSALPTKISGVSKSKPYTGLDPLADNPLPIMNILMLGMDSVSRVNYHRHMPKTERFIESHFSTVEFMAHHKIGENTLPNLMVMLLGQYYKDIVCGEKSANATTTKECMPVQPPAQSTFFFDDKDIIWKHFQNNGYYTLFAEDTAHQGLFRRFRRMGFRNVPVDFYYRAMSLYIHDWQLATSERFCAFGQIEPLHMMNYIKKVCTQLKLMQQPYFSFTFTNKMTHMKMANLGYLDIPTRDLIANISTGKAGNNTLIILFSDHGNRMDSFRNTFHGAFEERLPLLKFVFPKWFPQAYPKQWNTLNQNSKVLTSHFDTHRTLLHLSGWHEPLIDIVPTSKIGHSLFTPISPRRSCSDAGIPIHHCACNVNKMLSTKDAQIKNYARALVDFINAKLRSYRKLCIKWTFKKVLAAKMALITSGDDATDPREQHISNRVDSAPTPITKIIPRTSPNRYLISFTTHPRSATFEGSIIASNGTIEHIDDVTRTNEYGPSAWCMENEEIKPYCFCKYSKS